MAASFLLHSLRPFEPAHARSEAFIFFRDPVDRARSHIALIVDHTRLRQGWNSAQAVNSRKRRTMQHLPESVRKSFRSLSVLRSRGRPRLAGTQRRAFYLADRDHLPGMRFGQFASAGKTTSRTDVREISVDFLLRFGHFEACQFYVISCL